MILPLQSATSLAESGGKAANLACLARAGFCVPPGFIITTRAYRDHLSTNQLEEWILETATTARIDDPMALEAASAAIRSRFAGASLNPEVAAAVHAAYAALGAPSVAVRSSATTEDLPNLSFAGQQDTMLNVIGIDAVLHAVVQCWSSLWTARAIAYRARNEIPHEQAALAVIIQVMVASEVSGVLFTANPLSGKRAETVIEATFGLGEALVSGRVEPDRYIVDVPTGRVLEREIGAKALSIRPRQGGGTLETKEDLRDRASLSEATAFELAILGQRVARLFDAPQDIEWARAHERFYLLQSRPITSLFPLPVGLPNEELRVLMSVGAFQGMLDPFTPLGGDAFTIALPKAVSSIGGPLAQGRARPFIVAGERIFLDLTPMVRRPSIRVLVRNALRVIEPTTGEALDRVLGEFARAPLELRPWVRASSWRLVVLLMRVAGNATFNELWPDRGRARIQRRLAAVVEEFTRRGATAQDLGARVALLEELFSGLLTSWLPLLMPGLGVGLANLRLAHVLAAGVPDAERRVLELTRGLPHNVTTEMDLALWEVARAIRIDPSAALLIQTGSAPSLAQASASGRLPPAAQRVIDAFLRKYGMRGVGEIDLGRPRWSDDPTPLLQVLKSYLRIDRDNDAPDAVFRRGREVSERTLISLVADVRRKRFGRLKAFLMKGAARRVRALAGLRESPKFTIVTMLGEVRRGLLASGTELTGRGILDRSDDVFFLHVDELRALAAGEERDWRALVRERRKTYSTEQRRRRIPRLLLSDGRAMYGDASGGDATSGPTLSGTPVSPGVCAGRVRVVADPHVAQLAPGEILVCRGTDPAWTPLFLVAAGLVTEVGGLITHGAVVAREYGIPAVVGVRDATTRLRTGDWVRVDGTSGTVTVLQTLGEPRQETACDESGLLSSGSTATPIGDTSKRGA